MRWRTCRQRCVSVIVYWNPFPKIFIPLTCFVLGFVLVRFFFDPIERNSNKVSSTSQRYFISLAFHVIHTDKHHGKLTEWRKTGASINQITRQSRPFLQSFDANGGRHFRIQWSRKWGSKISCPLSLTFSKGIAAILLQNFAPFSFRTERFVIAFMSRR